MKRVLRSQFCDSRRYEPGLSMGESHQRPKNVTWDNLPVNQVYGA